MIRPLVVVGCLLMPSVFAASAEAQMIRVGPWGGVRVRVPFVGVDVSPWGDTRVRAPFTHIETPGHRYHHDHHRHHGHYDHGYRGYHYPHVFSPGFGLPAYAPQRRYSYGTPDAPPLDSPYHPYHGPVAVPPSSDSRWSLDRDDDNDAYRVPEAERYGPDRGVSPAGVADRLRAAAQRLRGGLIRRGEQGEIWLDYLQPDRILAAIDGGQPPESLQPLLDNFEGAVNSQVDWVTRIDGFRETHRLLSQYVTAGSGEPEPARPQDAGRQGSDREMLELPPPVPEPTPEAADDVDQAGEPQSAAADSPERFSL